MFVNRLTADRLTAIQPVMPQKQKSHEATELSLCDEGMCFLSEIPHEVGTVLSVNFQPDAETEPDLLESEGVVVECLPLEPQSEGYQITVLFTENYKLQNQ